MEQLITVSQIMGFCLRLNAANNSGRLNEESKVNYLLARMVVPAMHVLPFIRIDEGSTLW